MGNVLSQSEKELPALCSGFLNPPTVSLYEIAASCSLFIHLKYQKRMDTSLIFSLYEQLCYGAKDMLLI